MPKKEERPHVLEVMKRVEAGVRLRAENDALKAENQTLRHVLDEVLWQARRYADYRSSFAPTIYNDAVKLLLKTDYKVYNTDGIIWARDAMGRDFDNLSEAAATEGTPEALGEV